MVTSKDGENHLEDIKFVYKSSQNLGGDESEESDLIEDESDDESDQVFDITFEDEVKSIIQRQRDERHEVDSVKVEVNSIKFSTHKSNSE